MARICAIAALLNATFEMRSWHEVTYGHDVQAVCPAAVFFEGLLGQQDRFCIGRIEGTGGRVGPPLHAPSRVERQKLAKTDVPHVALGQLRRHGLRRVPLLPQKLCDRPELFEFDTFVDVDTVDAECRQLANELLIRWLVAAGRLAIETDFAPDDVNAQQGVETNMAVDRGRRAL